MSLILMMIIVRTVCRSSFTRNFLTNLWLAVQKVWSWNARVIVKSSKQIMSLSWILHDYQNWARKLVEAQTRDLRSKETDWDVKMRKKKEKNEKSKENKKVKKKNFFFDEARKNELVLDDRMWMIWSSSNQKTLRSSDSQWCREKIDRSDWCYQVLRELLVNNSNMW